MRHTCRDSDFTPNSRLVGLPHCLTFLRDLNVVLELNSLFYFTKNRETYGPLYIYIYITR